LRQLGRADKLIAIKRGGALAPLLLLAVLYLEAIGTEVPFLRSLSRTDGAVAEPPNPSLSSRRRPFAFVRLMMNRPPRVLSASVVHWEEYGWGISADYDDGKRIDYYVGSLAEAEIQVIKIKNDAFVAAHVRERG
jgi:hypothetical protein